MLRQQFALRLLLMLEKAENIVNIDESWLNSQRFVRKIWVPSDAAGSVTDKQVHPRISLILAMHTDGSMWCALTQATTDSDVMTLFLKSLMRELDRKDPCWKENTIFLLDNASWHSSEIMMTRM